MCVLSRRCITAKGGLLHLPTHVREKKILCTLIRKALSVLFKARMFLRATSPVAVASLLPA